MSFQLTVAATISRSEQGIENQRRVRSGSECLGFMNLRNLGFQHHSTLNSPDVTWAEFGDSADGLLSGTCSKPGRPRATASVVLKMAPALELLVRLCFAGVWEYGPMAVRGTHNSRSWRIRLERSDTHEWCWVGIRDVSVLRCWFEIRVDVFAGGEMPLGKHSEPALHLSMPLP